MMHAFPWLTQWANQSFQEDVGQPPSSDRIIGGTEVSPPCPHCRYPFYGLIGTNWSIYADSLPDPYACTIDRDCPPGMIYVNATEQ